MRGGDGGDVSGDRGVGDGLVSSVPVLDYDNDLNNNNSNNGVLVLDHMASDVADLHGGLGGPTTSAFASADGYFDMGTGMMVPEASGIHYGGSYPVQHGELPTVGSSASGYHQVYYDESNGNIMP
ncbi:hypothetical protein SCUCBS95973_002645 [Sporothrix curviconia]|uniref:Uncharacterized protein n=1 Tax=Sporothrix curviconia TaxID=1260050 RepID=A0ABP0B8V6_9PEZI